MAAARATTTTLLPSSSFDKGLRLRRGAASALAATPRFGAAAPAAAAAATLARPWASERACMAKTRWTQKGLKRKREREDARSSCRNGRKKNEFSARPSRSPRALRSASLSFPRVSNLLLLHFTGPASPSPSPSAAPPASPSAAAAASRRSPTSSSSPATPTGRPFLPPRRARGRP